MLVFVLVCNTLCSFLILQLSWRGRELIALLLLSPGCFVAVNVLWLFLTVSWVTVSVVCDCGISALSYSHFHRNDSLCDPLSNLLKEFHFISDPVRDFMQYSGCHGNQKDKL